MTALTSIVARPVEGIMPGGCIPPSERRTFPPMPPIDRNCWDPRTWGVQLPSPDAAVQATEAAALLA